jgi:cysteine desulfurase / selenocysteine lyase
MTIIRDQAPMDTTPENTSFAHARKRFPGLEKWTYLDSSNRGLPPVDVREAVDALLDERMHSGGDKKSMFATVERVRGRFARLINADPHEIAFTKNVSEGINAIATALPWREGDNVVLCKDLEHPNNVYIWLALAKRFGIEVRSVPGREGHLPVDRLMGAMDERTRVVSISTVTFSPGFRVDTEALGAACRQRDALLFADAVQSVGTLCTDVDAMNVDALAVSTQKGLLGLYGLGFLYCRRAWAERLTPAYLARFGVDMGEAHEGDLGEDDFRLMPGARRFDVGNYNYVAAAAVDRTLDLIQGLGTRAVEDHVRGLTHRLAEGFLDLGLPVCGGPPGKHTGAIIAVGEFGAGSHDGADDPAIQALYDRLTENRVKLSVRRGILRFGLHLYNNTEDVERVIKLARG